MWPKSLSPEMQKHVENAKNGECMDQAVVGECYLLGTDSFEQSHAEAMKWFIKAAEQDDVVAQYYLGKMYKESLGVPRDDIEAYKWLTLAKMNTYIYTRDEFGTYTTMTLNKEKAEFVEKAILERAMLKSQMDGEEIEEGKLEVGRWLIGKAEKGDPDAQVWLAEKYFAGDHFPQDYVKSYQWYKIAQNSYYFIKNHGCNETLAADAEAKISQIEEKIKDFDEQGIIDLHQLQQASVLTANWYKNASKRGVPSAQRAMGIWDDSRECAV